MDNDVFSFLWHVPEDGHRWVQARVFEDGGLGEEPRWVLMEKAVVGQPYTVRRYAPLDKHVALFRTFAEIPPDDREAILRFANTYGNLGVGRLVLEPRASGDPPGHPAVLGEKWQDWANEVSDMRRALDLWDLVERRDLGALSRLVFWRDEEVGQGGQPPRRAGWYYESRPSGRLRHEAFIEPVPDLFRPGDPFTPAGFLVQRWINKHLEGGVSPRLVYDLESGKRSLQFMPGNLLSALWLQFAQAVEGARKFRACKNCGKWFGVSLDGDGRTVRRVFCSPNCKSQDYRQRRDKARQLKREGKSIKDIAKELDTELDTVKGWIKGTKGK
jgi:hypothetical protein